MAVEFATLSSLAALGVPEAKLLLSMKASGVQRQDEQDRRWRNVSAAVEKLKADGKGPATGKDFLNVFARYGYVPNCPLSPARQCQQMEFPDFMAVTGGLQTIDEYPAQDEPDAPPRCEGCRTTNGVDMRCSWCGEWYCSTKCFNKERRDHMPTCECAVANMHCSAPPTPKAQLWTSQRYATTFGLRQRRQADQSSICNTPSSSAGGGGRPTGTNSTEAETDIFAGLLGALTDASISQARQECSRWPDHYDPDYKLTKGQKKNAKKKAKKAAARAAAAIAAAAEPSVVIEEVE